MESHDRYQRVPRSHVVLVSILALMVVQDATGDAPDRTIQGHAVVSTHDPAVQIRLPASATYVGADR
jgi:hypothetical protein